MKKIIRSSLARKLTIKLALILIVVFTIVNIGAFHIVSRLAKNQSITFNRSMADSFLDFIVMDASKNGDPIGMKSADMLKALGEYYCNKDYVGYEYTYSVCDDKKHILLLSSESGAYLDLEDYLPKELIGTEIEYTPSEDELKLWNGEVSSIDIDNHFINRTIESVSAQDDSYGHRIVVGVSVSLSAIDKVVEEDFRPLLAIIIPAFFALTVLIYFIIRKGVLNPAKRISNRLSEFIKDGNTIGEKLDESGNDEFAMISASFNKMIDDTNEYLERIKKLNSARERQKAEVSIASDIQKGFLAPEKYSDERYEISAVMNPARNVGGDLYDYMPLQDGREFITIADVSGKGLGAAMYMGVTLVMLRQFALIGMNPGEMLKATNNILTYNNKGEYFTTAFVGIYDPKTGELTYSNAGHLLPYILRDKPEMIEGARNIVLGLYENEEYTEDKVILNPGDILFLYTDGVTDAVDESRKFFGEERLKKLMEGFRSSGENDVVEYVMKALKDHMKDADAYDDITMLACYAKPELSLDILPETKEFGKIKKVILGSNLPGPMQRSLCVAAEEIFQNICSYAFEGFPEGKDKRVRFIWELGDVVKMRFEDNGMKYDPTEEVNSEEDYDPDTHLGGLGKTIAFTIADEVKYEYTDEKNILTIIKNLAEVQL